jgi:hypothetical protein
MSGGIVLKSREETEKIVDLMCAQIEQALRAGVAQDVESLRRRQSLVIRLETYFDAWVAAEPCPIEYSFLYDRWGQLQEGWLALHRVVLSDMFRLGVKEFRTNRLEDYEWRVFADLDAALADDYNGPDDEAGADEDADASELALPVPGENEAGEAEQKETVPFEDEDPQRTFRHVVLDAAAIVYTDNSLIEYYLESYCSNGNQIVKSSSSAKPKREALRLLLAQLPIGVQEQARNAKSLAQVIHIIQKACDDAGIKLPRNVTLQRDTVARELGFRKG